MGSNPRHRGLRCVLAQERELGFEVDNDERDGPVKGEAGTRLSWKWETKVVGGREVTQSD